MPPEAATLVRPADEDDRVAVLAVLEGALLEVDPDAVAARIGTGDVLVAVDGDRVVGALVAAPADADGSGARVEAMAVRSARRREGVGRALVDAAAARYGRLTADFRAAVRPFYAAVGFEVTERADGRWRGTR